MFLIENFMFLIESLMDLIEKIMVLIEYFMFLKANFMFFIANFISFISNSDAIDAKYHQMALFASALFLCSPPLSVQIDTNLHQLLCTSEIPSMPCNLEKVQKMPKLVKQVILLRANWYKMKYSGNSDPTKFLLSRSNRP